LKQQSLYYKTEQLFLLQEGMDLFSMSLLGEETHEKNSEVQKHIVRAASGPKTLIKEKQNTKK
jgi:hypothetical protein